MVSVFLLVVLFLTPAGELSIGVQSFNSMQSCEANIKSTTNFLLEHNINKASVTCSEHKIGTIS